MDSTSEDLEVKQARGCEGVPEVGVLGVRLESRQFGKVGDPTIADGVDEVHKATVARNVLKSYAPHDGYWPTEYYPEKRKRAREKFEPMFEADPELRDMADAMAKYMARRG